MNELSARLDAAADSLGSLARIGEPLGPLCTYKVGGQAALFVEAESVADLEAVVAVVARYELPTLVVGKGSNMLVADAGFPGVALHLGDGFSEIHIEMSADPTVEATVILGAAGLLPIAARRTAAAGLTGFEWAVGVPGSVGGAVRMNAGGHGSDMAASVTKVSVFDLAAGGPTEWTVNDLELGYRRSALEAHHVVLFAELALERGDRATSEAEINEIVRWRRANQPGGQNAGSVFTNPAGDSAGRLIDRAGLKGLRIGTAEVSPKHANFIQADPDGSADDVYRLISTVRHRVADRFGIVLHCENRLIGFEPLETLVTDDIPGRSWIPGGEAQ
ncbi:MAG: UDP-N-acetylmuramate dehydrogenase [Actinomycetia bacterium]|nr:UDP-N-acetylmuramate dehydrogenase [Actinomycetes bacterium]MCP5034359.1 UDP-N-acetylmuramate dehydrogenase [Actinomycetes bacterium]